MTEERHPTREMNETSSLLLSPEAGWDQESLDLVPRGPCRAAERILAQHGHAFHSQPPVNEMGVTLFLPVFT